MFWFRRHFFVGLKLSNLLSLTIDWRVTFETPSCLLRLGCNFKGLLLFHKVNNKIRLLSGHFQPKYVLSLLWLTIIFRIHQVLGQKLKLKWNHYDLIQQILQHSKFVLTCGVVDLWSSDALRRETEYDYAKYLVTVYWPANGNDIHRFLIFRA